MPRRKTAFPRLSPAEAHAALRWLHALRKVKASDIAGALKHREQLVQEIKERLEQLGGEGFRFLRGLDGLRKRTRKAPKRASKAARAAWRAQGRYMAAVRRLPKADRAKVKAIREKSGVRAAIAAAKRLANPRNAPPRRTKKASAKNRSKRSRQSRRASKKRAEAVATTTGAQS